jgi:uncharacterized membrane protein
MLLLKKIKSYFTTGLYFLLPIFLTFYALKTVSYFLLSLSNEILFYLPFLRIRDQVYSEVGSILALIIILGYIINLLNLENILRAIEERIIKQIPLISNIYLGIKKITALIKSNKEKKEQTVVWVKLNDRETYILGFLVNTIDEKHTPNNETLYSVFVPTTPNPVSGYYIITKRENLVYTKINPEDAISMIISGGIIQPN